MSDVRETVEWGFKDTVSVWKFIDDRSSMKIFKPPVAKYYMVSAFLTKTRSTYCGNQTSRYSRCPTMLLSKYLALVDIKIE